MKHVKSIIKKRRLRYTKVLKNLNVETDLYLCKVIMTNRTFNIFNNQTDKRKQK
jgi:hypothetical protein